MNYSDVLAQLKALGQRLEAHWRIVFFRLEAGDAATSERLASLEEKLGYAVHPSLRAAWAESDSIDLEWFVKGAGCKAAGIDSHSAPSGQFKLLTPEEAETERSFLVALGGGENAERSLPFSKVSPNGELIVLDHTSGVVQMVVLDAELTTTELAPSLDAWFKARMLTFFEEQTLRYPDRKDPGVEVTLEQMTAAEFSWPPRKIGW